MKNINKTIAKGIIDHLYKAVASRRKELGLDRKELAFATRAVYDGSLNDYYGSARHDPTLLPHSFAAYRWMPEQKRFKRFKRMVTMSVCGNTITLTLGRDNLNPLKSNQIKIDLSNPQSFDRVSDILIECLSRRENRWT